MIREVLASIELGSLDEKTLLTPSFVNPGVLKRNLAIEVGNLANIHVHTFSSFIVERATGIFPERTHTAGDRLFKL